MSSATFAAPAARLAAPLAPPLRRPTRARAVARAPRAAAPRAELPAGPVRRVTAAAAAAVAAVTAAVTASAAFADEAIAAAAEPAATPLDYATLFVPLVAYGIFYAWREKNDVRAARAPCTRRMRLPCAASDIAGRNTRPRCAARPHAPRPCRLDPHLTRAPRALPRILPARAAPQPRVRPGTNKPPAPPPPPPPPPAAAASKPAAAAAAAPPTLPKYSGPVTRPASGRDAFDLVRTCIADTLQVDPSSFSEKTTLLKDHQLTNEDAAEITQAIADRGGIVWIDADTQIMRMALLQLSLLEISHVVSDRAGVPRLDAWPGKGGAGDSVDFV
jgi:hypothetical protein